MKAVLSGKEMKAFDTRSIRGYGIPSLVLMEQAALAVAEKAEEILKREQAETVWSVCGFGNNGADGVAAARPSTPLLATMPATIVANAAVGPAICTWLPPKNEITNPAAIAV